MTILIDCTHITVHKAGVGVYAINLVTSLIANYPHTCFYLLIQDDDHDFDLVAANLITLKVKATLFRRLPLRLLLEQFYIPWLTTRLSIDIVHSLHYSFPLLPIKAKKVITIHDLTSHIMPEVHTKSRLAYFRFFLWATQRKSVNVIFCSESTKNDYFAVLSRMRSSCHVVLLGKDDNFHPSLDKDDTQKVLTRLGIVQPYILYLGTLEPRKNVPRLLRAFASIQKEHPTLTLVIAGKKGWMYQEIFDSVSELGMTDKVSFLGYIEESDKPFLISGSQLFAYPSLYEGFGIPVLEALACGVPTITSNLSSMPEVAGDAALLVDPYSIQDIAAAMKQLLESPSVREAFSKKAIVHASSFSWSRTAEETFAVYNVAVRRAAVDA
jgi:glycosyltransferase involved in cell wall biosynthesis